MRTGRTGLCSGSNRKLCALLGWSPEGNNEIFSLEEMVKEFDYHRMNKSPSVFDMTKLRWMNGEYIKAMDFDRFYKLLSHT